jgi:2-dehydropantoate 2-reductase
MATTRFIVYGAGAIGGSLGALLHRAGYEVVLIARGAHLAAIRSGGLRFVTAEGAAALPITAVSDPREAGITADDIVLLTMKGMDTEAALRDLAAVADPATAIVCVQNGVANERAALRHFARVYAVGVMFPATHLEPGVVQLKAWPVPAILDIGRYPTGVDATAEALSAVFRAAGCHSVPRPEIMRWKYTKLLINLGNAFDAIAGGGDEIAEIVDRARAEGAEVLAAAGIPFASDEEDRARRGDILQLRPRDGKPAGNSSWQSLARGTGAIEADYLNGEIVLLGRLHDVPTPVNETVRQLANRCAREGRLPGSVPVAELLASIDEAAHSR